MNVYMQTLPEEGQTASKCSAQVSEVNVVNASVRHIVLEVEGRPNFMAGQYLQIHVPDADRWLPLSIASGPALLGRVEIIVRAVEGGLGSQYLFALKPGDTAQLRLPYGMAWLRLPKGRRLVIAVGSSGVSYARSLLSEALRQVPELQVQMFYAVQHENDLCLMHEWRALAQLHSGFELIPVVGEPKENWSGETGLITEAMERRLSVPDPDLVDAYIAGPPPMVQAVAELLRERGIPERRVYSDMFSSKPQGDVRRMLSECRTGTRITSPIMDGQTYLESLRDGRDVWVGGERVLDVTEHPAFANAARYVAGLYDLQNDPAVRDRMTFDIGDGHRAHLAYLLPKTREDLQRRRQAIEMTVRPAYGFFNRGPEYKSGFLVGMMSNLPFFGDRAENVEALYQRVVRNNIYLNHVFVTPQVDRAKSASEQPESHLYVGTVRELDDGIIVRGAKMVGTAAALNHEIVIGHYGGIRAMSEDDRDYAIMFTVPVNAPGVRLIARSSMRKPVRNPADAPFSHYLEENDLTVVLEDVFVPWEDVFIYRDVKRTNSWMVETPSLLNLIYNNAVRFHQKLRFLSGLGQRIAQSTDIEGFRGVQSELGQLAVYAGMLKGLIQGADASAITLPSGIMIPDPEVILAYRGLGPKIYPEVVSLVEKLGGGGLIQLPDSIDDIREGGPLAEVARYYRGAEIGGVERAMLMKLAWDVLRSDYAGRHVLFERFHAGAPDDTLIQYYLGTGARAHGGLVDEALSRIADDSFLDASQWPGFVADEHN